MNDIYVKNRVNKILSELILKDDLELNDSDRLLQDLGIDSLDLVDLLMQVEKKFSITITKNEADLIRTVKDIYEIINSKLK